MISIPRILLLSYLLTCCLFGSAQSLTENETERPFARQKYLLVLPNEVVQQMQKKKGINEDLSFWMQYVIDSAGYDSGAFKRLAAGVNNYMLHVFKDEVHITPIKDKNWRVMEIVQQGISGIKVFDIYGTELTDCRINYRNKNIVYNSKLALYPIKKVKKNKELVISRSGQIAFYCLDTYKPRPIDKLWLPVSAVFRPKPKKTFKGFIAFSQPIYRPGDTIRLKAYVLDKKGKPYRDTLTINLSTYHYGRGSSGKITAFESSQFPLAPGNFVWDIPVNDTFIIDKSYQVRLLKKGLEVGISESIYIEDYQLDKTSYTLKSTLPNANFHYGDVLDLEIQGTDATGKPVMDAEVFLYATAYVSKLYTRELFVPDTLWQIRQSLHVSGKTTLSFPDSLIPNGMGRINIYAHFKNSNNELHTDYLSIQFDKNSTKWQVSDADSLYVALLKNNQLTSQKIWLRALDFDGRTLFEKEIANPHKEPVSALASSYYLYTQDQKEKYTYSPTASSNIHATIKESNDTFLFELKNPRELNCFITLFEGKKLLTNLTTREAMYNFVIANGKGKSYYAKVSYVWHGVEDYNHAQYIFKANELKVDIEHQPEVQPGQKENITLTVTDAYGNPSAGTNVTAAAFNAQFSNAKYPQVPYMGKDKYPNPTEKYFTLKEQETATKVSLKEKDLGRFNLRDIYYYQMRFPEKGRVEKYVYLPGKSAQLQVYVHQNGQVLKTYYIEEDNQLITHNWVNSEGSFLVDKPYEYNQFRLVKIRLNDKIIYAQHVKIIPHHATVLSINLDEKDSFTTALKAKRKLSKAEKKAIENATLLVKTYNDWRNNWVLMSPHKTYSLMGSYGSVYNHLGPFIPNSQLVLFNIMNGKKIPFEFLPGYGYQLKSDNLIAKPQPFFTKRKVKLKSPSVDHQHYFNVAFEKDLLQHATHSDIYFMPKLPYEGDCQIKFLSEGDFRTEKLIIEPLMTFQAWPYGHGNCPALPEGSYRFKLIRDSGYYHQTPNLLAKKGGTLYYNIPDEMDLPLIENNQAIMDKFGRKNFPTYYKENTQSTLILRFVNKQTDEPLPFVKTLLLHLEGKSGKLITADAWGYVWLDVVPGTYRVSPVDDALSHAADLDFKVFPTKGMQYEVRFWVAPSYSPAVYLNESHDIRGYTDGIAIQRLPSRSINAIESAKSGRFKVRKYKSPDFGVDDEELYDKSAEDGLLYSWSFDSVSLPNVDNSVPSLRTSFKDNAYWMPTLYTNEKGKVSFGITYPDDITSWRHYGAAINEKKQSGLGFSTSKAYKKVAAELALPRFAIEGDELLAIGKAMNFTGINTPVSLSFIQADKQTVKDTLLRDIITQKLPLLIPAWQKNGNNTLKPTYALQLPNGYQDGEQRDLLVYPKGVEHVNGFFSVLENDTQFNIKTTQSGELTLHAENSSLDFLLQTLNQVQTYPYDCNEQMASKLRALLTEQKIKATLSLPFDHHKEIKKLIKALEKAQNDDGSWGWWPKARTDYYMTAYIMQALYIANQQGFKNDALEKAKSLVRSTVHFMPANQALFALDVLSFMKEPYAYEEIIKKIALVDTSFSDKMTIELIKARENLDVNTSWIAQQKRESYLGNAFYPGEQTMTWHTAIQNTLKVYEINKLTQHTEENKQLIRFFLEQKNGRYGWQSTIETAKIVETILPDFLANKKMGRTASLQVTTPEGTGEVAFPYTLKTDAQTPVNIRYNGSEPVYFTAYQKQWLPEPQAKTDHFVVSSSFVQDNKMVTDLKSGKQASLQVTVVAKKFGEYLMLTVPIPAGCSYGDKKNVYGNAEIHREYFKNEVAIFIDNIGPGTYTYTVPLEVRFEGQQTLNPARVELMYFPTFQGYNQTKKVKVSDE